MDDKEKVIDSFKINIEAVLDDKALNDIADRLYDKIVERFSFKTSDIDVKQITKSVSEQISKANRNYTAK